MWGPAKCHLHPSRTTSTPNPGLTPDASSTGARAQTSYETVLKDASVLLGSPAGRSRSVDAKPWLNPNAAPLGARAQTSYETVLKDASVFLGIANWAVMIVDEAHRFKSVAGATRQKVVDMRVRWKLLLTGAPEPAGQGRACLGSTSRLI